MDCCQHCRIHEGWDPKGCTEHQDSLEKNHDCFKYKRDAEDNVIRDAKGNGIPEYRPTWPLTSRKAIVGTPPFISVEIMRKTRSYDANAKPIDKYDNSKVFVGEHLQVNESSYRPIAVLSYRNSSPHFWCYVNRGNEKKDIWYKINDDHMPEKVTHPNPENVLLVVYERIGPNLSKEHYKY